MYLTTIDDLQLYVDREIKQKNKSVEKRIPLENDLEVGEVAYFNAANENKIVKINEEEYLFCRFDEIQTHIDTLESNRPIDDIGKEITNNFDYDLEYSNERVSFIEQEIEENNWIYDILSSNRVIQKEQKKKNSFLAENQRLDSYFQRMADYILHPKFNDKESKLYYESIQNEYKELRDKKSKTDSEISEMISLKEEIDLFNQGIISKSRNNRNNKREEMVENFNSLEQRETIYTDFNTDKSKITQTGKDLKIDDGYWERMGFSPQGVKFREEVIQTYEEALSIIAKQLGHGESSEIKDKIQRELIKNLKPIRYHVGKREINITSEVRLNKISKMYSELKSDYHTTKEILAEVVSFNQVEPTFTKYNFNVDTWYENEDGEIIEISKNAISFSNPNTYKALILNYYDLKDRYQSKFNDDMWAILHDFENLLTITELNSDEKFILSKIMSDYTRKEIVEQYEQSFNKTISMYSISNMINKTIPNKMLKTYLQLIDDWVYTYILKGKYKKCSKCEEIKLISNQRYFGKNTKTTDGFQSVCKKCDGLRKKPK